MSDNNQLGELPLGADPRLAQLAALQGQAAAPQAAPSSVFDPDLKQLLQRQSQLGMGAFDERERASMAQAQRIQELEQSMPGLARQTVFQPRFGPERFTDIRGHEREIPGTGGFLHNLGQALLTFGAATRPGQAIEGVVKAGPRAEFAAKTAELGRLRGEQQAMQEPMSAAAQLAYKPISAGAEVESAEAKTARVVNQAQKIANDLAMGMRGLDIKALVAGSQVELNKARAYLDRNMPAILFQRNQLIEKGIDVGALNRQIIEEMAGKFGLDRTHPLMMYLDEKLGGGFSEMLPGATGVPGKLPGAGTTAPGAITGKPKAKGNAAPEGTVIQMQDGSHQVKRGGKWVPQ